MRLFHKHNWIKIKETYAPPANRKYKAKGFINDNTPEKLAFGVTTILWECSICKKIRKEEMLGK